MTTETKEKVEGKVEEKAGQLPQPSGYHILCAIPNVEDKYESGLIKADTQNILRKFYPLCFLY